MTPAKKPLTRLELLALTKLVPRFEKEMKRGRNAETPRVMLSDFAMFKRLRDRGLVRLGVIAEPTEEAIRIVNDIRLLAASTTAAKSAKSGNAKTKNAKTKKARRQ